MKIYAYPHFYAGGHDGTTIFHENFWQNWKKVFFDFFKSFHGQIIVPSCFPHKNVDMHKFS